MTHKYNNGLDKNPANHSALTPLSFVQCGAVLNTLNFRLDAASLEFILDHGEARVLFYDTEFEALVKAAIAGLEIPPLLVSIEHNGGVSEGLAQYEYETLLASAAPTTDWQRPVDEWDAISLNYTSGTTGNPKGVVYHHRGAYLAARMARQGVATLSLDEVRVCDPATGKAVAAYGPVQGTQESDLWRIAQNRNGQDSQECVAGPVQGRMNKARNYNNSARTGAQS